MECGGGSHRFRNRKRQIRRRTPNYNRAALRIVFFGTPAFAVPTLEALVRKHEIVLVVAQPDKPSGRGMHVHVPAVIEKAHELGLKTNQPPKVRDVIDDVRDAKADAGIVVAYGKILPSALLEIPRHGFLNIHGSILPKYRGAAPIQRAIEHGEPESGVTIMQVDEQLDHGAMLSVARTPIGPDEHTPSLAARLSHLGAEALLHVLSDLDGHVPIPQDDTQATFAPKVEKSEGAVQWSEPARRIYNKFRAFDPWPGLFTPSFKLIDIRPVDGSGAAGTIIRVENDGVVVACGEAAIKLLRVQRPGKAAVDARALQWKVGAVIDHV